MTFKRALQTITRPLARFAARKFYAASSNRLFADWILAALSWNDDVRQGLPILRSRARDLEQNNPYVRRWLTLLESEVIGPAGIRLQNRAARIRLTPDGDYEEVSLEAENRIVEREWGEWGKKGNCTVCGRFSFAELTRKVLRWTARDGDFLVVIRRGKQYGRWGMQLQVLRGDYIDHEYCVPRLENGNMIDMGVEIDPDGRRVAFHVLGSDPRDTYRLKHERTRILASDCLYICDPMSPDEPRSVSWLHSVMSKIKMLDGGTEAELVAMRTEACKVFAWEDIGGLQGKNADERKGSAITNDKLSPGQSVYRPGKKLTSIDPKHPNGNFAGFHSCILHEIAAGMMTSHASLSGDLSKVNYSSMRAGTLLERAYYKMLQAMMIEGFNDPIFAIWYEQAVLTNALPFSGGDEATATFCRPSWNPKRWAWVDPLKDVLAHLAIRRANWMSDSMIMAAMGNDFEEVRNSIKRDRVYDEKNDTAPGEDAFRSMLDNLDEKQLTKLTEYLLQDEEAA